MSYELLWPVFLRRPFGWITCVSSCLSVDEPITFYLPYRRDGIASLPSSLADYWSWLLSHEGISKGKYSWTLQTYMQLSEAGLACRLSEEFPRSGIVISHRDFLPIFLAP